MNDLQGYKLAFDIGRSSRCGSQFRLSETSLLGHEGNFHAGHYTEGTEHQQSAGRCGF